MGNINSGQLSCSNLDKLGVDRSSDILDHQLTPFGQHRPTGLSLILRVVFMGNINLGQSNCLTKEKLGVNQ